VCELTRSSELVVVEYDAQSSQTLCWHSQQVRETSSGPKDFRHTLQSSPLLVLPTSDFLEHRSRLSGALSKLIHRNLPELIADDDDVAHLSLKFQDSSSEYALLSIVSQGCPWSGKGSRLSKSTANLTDCLPNDVYALFLQRMNLRLHELTRCWATACPRCLQLLGVVWRMWLLIIYGIGRFRILPEGKNRKETNKLTG